MKWIGQHIYDLVSRFRNDIYLEDISSGTIASGGNLGLDSNNKIVKASAGGISFDGSTANGVLTYKDSDEATVESTLTYDSETLTIGADDNGFATIERLTHSDDNGGNLNIAAGKGTGTSKTGGDIHLYGGQSTGVAEGGSLKFLTSTSDGSADANVNVVREVFEVTSLGNVVWIGTQIGNAGSDNDLGVITDGSMSFIIDRDNDETSQSFAWVNYATEIMNLDEGGNLQIDGGLTTGSTSFVNSSGVVQVATQGTIDHDSLANFVAAEHYDWSSDISGTATIHANNITDLHGAGVSGAANQLLTDDGDGTVTSESGLTYSSESLFVGDDDNGIAQVRRTTHTDDDGGSLYVRGGDATAGQTDKDGGTLRLYGGRGTSNGDGGAVSIFTSFATGSTGTVLHTNARSVATFRADGDTILGGDLVFEGPVVDGNDTKFSITEQTANRTITVPDATGTMCVSGASGTNIVVLGSGNGYVNAPAAQKWYFGNTLYGFNHFNWAGVNASMVSDSSTFTLSEDYNGVGQFVPATLSKVVARVSCRPATTSNETFKVTICSADRDAGGTNTTWTALASATNETSIGVWESCDATYTGSIATSKILSIGIGIDESSVSTGNVRFNWQLVGYLT